MKHRRLLLSLDLLPTIAETLEDSASLGVSTHPTTTSSSSSSSSSSCSQSQDEYMSSIQALASCPVLSSTCGPVRFQKVPTIRLFSKPQGRHSNSASLPCANPHMHRTSRASGFCLERPEEMTPWQGRGRGTGDPVDWLFGQPQTLRRTCGEPCVSPTLASTLWVL